MTKPKPCRCGRNKPLGKGRKLCDECQAAYLEDRRIAGLKKLHEWRELNPERYREYRRSFDKEHQGRIREHAASIKLERGCVDCGYNAHSAALDYDHVSGEKNSDISKCQSMAALLEEIEKCEVVCSNCHRIRTWKRRIEYELGK